MLAAAALVLLAAPPASADQDGPVSDLIDQVARQVTAPSTAEDSPKKKDGVSAADPDGNSAHSQVLGVGIGEREVVDLAESGSRIDSEDGGHADSTLLAVGGQEVIGTHTGPGSNREAHAGDPLAQLCEGSNGLLCLGLLYADAYSWTSEDASDARAQNGVLHACLGGEDGAERSASCSGPVEAGVIESSARSHRATKSGRTSSESESHVADACVSPDDAGCAVGATVLQSRSSSDSGTSTEADDSATDGDSTPATVTLGGTEIAPADDPASLEVPPGCAAPVLVCLDLNESSSSAGDDAVSDERTAADADALTGTPAVVGADVAQSGTAAANDGGEAADDEAADGHEGDAEAQVAGVEAAAGGGPGRPGAAAGSPLAEALDTILPNTGGVASGLLAGAVLLLGGGVLVLARRRARV